MKKVISLPAWKRPDYLHETIQALKGAEGADEYTICVSLDGEPPQDARQRQIGILVEAGGNGLDLHYTQQKENQGCAGNTLCALQYARETSPESTWVLHLEEDIAICPDALRWVEACMGRFEEEMTPEGKVLAVCLLSGGVHVKDNNPRAVAAVQRFSCPGGWAMTWNNLAPIMDDWFGMTAQSPNFEGEEWRKRITSSLKGSWAWPMEKYWRRGRWCVFPPVARSTNIGRTGGVHVLTEDMFLNLGLDKLPVSNGTVHSELDYTRAEKYIWG